MKKFKLKKNVKNTVANLIRGSIWYSIKDLIWTSTSSSVKSSVMNSIRNLVRNSGWGSITVDLQNKFKRRNNK